MLNEIFLKSSVESSALPDPKKVWSNKMNWKQVKPFNQMDTQKEMKNIDFGVRKNAIYFDAIKVSVLL